MARYELEHDFGEKWDYWFSNGLHDIVLSFMYRASKHFKNKAQRRIFLELIQQGYDEAKERFLARCLKPCSECGAPVKLSGGTVPIDDIPASLEFTCEGCQTIYKLNVPSSAGTSLEQKRKRLDELAKMFSPGDPFPVRCGDCGSKIEVERIHYPKNAGEPFRVDRACDNCGNKYQTYINTEKKGEKSNE